MAATESRSLLTTLHTEHPEWRPLLVVIEEALRETGRPQWTRFVPALARSGGGGRPLLDGAVINVAPRPVGRWVRHILTLAAETAVSQDVDRLDELARALRDDGGVVRGLAPFIAMPMLQACRRAWAERVPAGWAHGYCPICGRWPALAEIRGLDGNRHLRCAPCGSDWRTELLRCPFCGEGDHARLGSLVSSDRRGRQTIEVCEGCRGYVKTLTTLTPMRPEHVVVQDLATLVLDVAALQHGYRRPAAKGHEVAVSVVAEPSRLLDLLCRA